jgi:DNA-binding protein HU-beta
VVNKDELSRLLAPVVGDRRVGREVVDLLFDSIAEAVARGEKVMITGMGVFERQERPARTGRNPATGEAVDLPADAVPRFSPSPIWREMVATGEVRSVKPKPRGRAANLRRDREGRR